MGRSKGRIGFEKSQLIEIGWLKNRNKRKIEKQSNNEFLSEEFKFQLDELNEVTTNILSRDTFIVETSQVETNNSHEFDHLAQETPPEMASFDQWKIKKLPDEKESHQLQAKSDLKLSGQVEKSHTNAGPIMIKKKDIRMSK